VLCRAAAPDAAGDAAASRRQLVLGIVTAAPALAAVSATPAAWAAAAAGTCDFVTAANGIQYCDTKEGEGPSPVKGALIRCAAAALPPLWLLVLCQTYIYQAHMQPTCLDGSGPANLPCCVCSEHVWLC
jgi:hypothetical protein